MIATVKDPKGTILPVAILHYFFKSGEEEDIVLAPYGNARGSCKRPYVRTAPSNLSRIKKECLHKKPKRLYGKKFSSNGGLLESDSASSEPRNPKQVYNARSTTLSHSKNEDKGEIFLLLTQLKDGYAGEGGFVQEVKFGKTPEVVVAFEQQMEDLARFCCNAVTFPSWASIQLSKWGNVFVTVTNEHPTFIGLCFIHM